MMPKQEIRERAARVCPHSFFNCTDEMLDFFAERSFKHLMYVKQCYDAICSPNFHIYNSNLFDHTVLDDAINQHDDSKFEVPELCPYVLMTWAFNVDKSILRDKDKEYITFATYHHYKNNKHHPEFWAGNYTLYRMLYTKDKPEVITAYNMPVVYLLEMCCDWGAMSLELDGNIETVLGWAIKNIGRRWLFTDSQKDVIFSTLNFMISELS